MAAGIQMGAVTQSQLQDMTLQSFSTINTIASTPQKPIPPAVPPELLSFMLSPFLIFISG
jgi:hypothetical protein